MKRLMFPLAVVVLGASAAPAFAVAPAWGGTCLSCHGEWQAGALQVFGEDLVADPDESGTGAPDRGPLKTFVALRGKPKALRAEVLGLDPNDTYAVQLKRLRFSGVEQGGTLAYGADCAWPEWGETANYYTEPAIAYQWSVGPTAFDFDIVVETGADNDYYDLVFAVAGKLTADDGLFYAEEHFYVQVVGVIGDMNCDGLVDFGDINPFVKALTNPVGYDAAYPNCTRFHADCNGDGFVDFLDINGFIDLL